MLGSCGHESCIQHETHTPPGPNLKKRGEQIIQEPRGPLFDGLGIFSYAFGLGFLLLRLIF